MLFSPVLAPVAHAQSPSPTASPLSSLAPGQDVEGSAITPELQVPPPDLKEGNQSVLPNVYATNLRALVTPQKTIEGSFTIENDAPTSVGGLRYSFLLLQPFTLPDDGQLHPDPMITYDQVLQAPMVSLRSGEKREVRFTYTPPRVPTGPYRFQVQLHLENDRNLGWDTVEVHLEGGGAYAIVEPFVVEVESVHPFFKDRRNKWAPLEGVNIDPGTAMTLRAKIQNVGTKPLVGRSVFTVRRLLMSESSEVMLPKDPLTLAPGEERVVPLALSAESRPGSYRVLLTVQNDRGERLSTFGEFRYVVRGLSASIVSQTLSGGDVQKGQTADVRFVVAGSADGERAIDAEAEVSLFDGEERAGTMIVPLHISAAGAVVGIAHVPLTRDICSDPSMMTTVRIKDSGQQLSTLKTPLSPETLSGCVARPFLPKNTVTLFLLVVIVLLVLIALVFLLRSQQAVKKYRGLTTTLMLLFLLGTGVGGGAALVFRSDTADANGYQVKSWGNMMSLWVNSPQHGQVVSGTKVLHQASVTFLYCLNTPSYWRYNVYSTERHVTGVGSNTWKFHYGTPLTWGGTEKEYGDYAPPTAVYSGYLNLSSYTTRPAVTIWTKAWASFPEFPTFFPYVYDFTFLTLNRPFPPLGEHTNADCVKTEGWACDPNDFTGTTTVEIREKTGTTWTTLGSVLANRAGSPTGACGVQSNKGFSFPIPASLKNSQPHELYAFAKDDGKVNDLGDVPLARTPRIIICEPPTPDLILQNLSVTGTKSQGQVLALNGIVRNAGTLSSGASTTQFSMDGSPLGTTPTGALAPSGTEAETFSWTATAGNHLLAICADSENAVAESNEANNCATFAFSVLGPAPQCLPQTQSVAIGQNATITASAGNGTYSWSASGGTPASQPAGTSTSFTTLYRRRGTKTVRVTSDGQTVACTVEVDVLSSSPSPTPGGGGFPPPGFEEIP